MQDAYDKAGKPHRNRPFQQPSSFIPPGAVALARISGETQADGFTLISWFGEPPTSSGESLANSMQIFTRSDLGKVVACVQPLGAAHVMVVGVVLNGVEPQNSLLQELLEQHRNEDRDESNIEARASGEEGVANEVCLDLNEVTIADLNEQDAALHEMEDLDSDPEKLVLRASQSVIIKCGESSLSLGADGRIRINGRNIFSRASHLQRISGGAIKLN